MAYSIDDCPQIPGPRPRLISEGSDNWIGLKSFRLCLTSLLLKWLLLQDERTRVAPSSSQSPSSAQILWTGKKNSAPLQV
jgi:hypothetical protein